MQERKQNKRIRSRLFPNRVGSLRTGRHTPPPPRISGSTPPPLPPSPDQTTRVVSRCGRTLLATVRNSARQRDLRVMGLFFRFSTTSRGISRKLKRADSRRAYNCADECNVLFLLGHIRSYDSDSIAFENEPLGFIYLESGLLLFARNAILKSILGFHMTSPKFKLTDYRFF